MDRRGRRVDDSGAAIRAPAEAALGAPTRGSATDGLSSWKEIAAYLGVTVRTAQRWERFEGLPVHRLMHAKLGSAYGFRTEIDAWRVGRGDPAEPSRDTPGPRSVAVLPFANLNRDLDTEIVADGLTEELITALARVPGVRVLARTSVFRYKHKRVDVRELAATLAVDTLLEGSVRHADGRIRVTARLVDAHDGLERWSLAGFGRGQSPTSASVDGHSVVSVIVSCGPRPVACLPPMSARSTHPGESNPANRENEGRTTCARGDPGPTSRDGVARASTAAAPATSSSSTRFAHAK